MIITDLQYVMQEDSWQSTTPVSHTVVNPEYEWLPGGPEYQKGGSLVRMLNGFLTEETFKSGLLAFFDQYSYGNADRDDLWEVMQAAGEADGTLDTGVVDLVTVMDGWVTQPGYPVVNVDSVSEDGATITLSQSRFFLNTTQLPDPSAWDIPISSSALDGSETATNWFLQTEPSVDLLVPSPYLLNYKVTGYYRVNYDRDNWEALIMAMQENVSSINRLNRAQLYDDAFNLARADLLSYEVPLNMSKSLASETEYIPLASALNGLGYLDLMIRDESFSYPYMKVLVTSLLTNLYNSLVVPGASEGDTFSTILSRELAMQWMCLYDYQDCLDLAAQEFSSWMSEEDPDAVNPIAPDMRRNVYATAVMKGGEDEFNFLLDRYKIQKADATK